MRYFVSGGEWHGLLADKFLRSWLTLTSSGNAVDLKLKTSPSTWSKPMLMPWMYGGSYRRKFVL